MNKQIAIPKIQLPTQLFHDTNIKRQENRWKRRILPKWLLSIKGRTCNPTPLVQQDMTKKTTFY